MTKGMRRVLGIALIVAVALGVVAVASKARKPPAEEHLKAFYAAERSRRIVGGGIGVPTLRDKLAKHWYKLRGKRDVDFLNELAKHRTALEVPHRHQERAEGRADR